MREVYIAISHYHHVLKDIYIKRSERHFKFTKENLFFKNILLA